MKAIVCDEPGHLTLVNRPEPTPAAGEVLVRIRRHGRSAARIFIFFRESTHISNILVSWATNCPARSQWRRPEVD